MKKIFIVFILVISSFASNVALRKMYVEELINYNITLPSKFYNPFIEEKNTTEKNITIPKEVQKIKKIPNLYVLGILNNTILVKLDDKIKSAKVGDTLEGYKILKVLKDNSGIVVMYDNKIKELKLNKDKINIQIKVTK